MHRHLKNGQQPSRLKKQIQLCFQYDKKYLCASMVLYINTYQSFRGAFYPFPIKQTTVFLTVKLRFQNHKHIVH